MKIGLDLDNTVIDYSAAFHAAAKYIGISLPEYINTKNKIKKHVLSLTSGEYVWQRIQGLAYGLFVNSHARLYPGVVRFLWRCREQKHEVGIVSHKTLYGHQDSSCVPLREVATAFLNSQDIKIGLNEFLSKIIFHDTYEGKISFIKNNSFDWFIDDLSSVISDLKEQKKINKIFFTELTKDDSQVVINDSKTRSLSNWQQIDAVINGDWTNHEIYQISNHLVKSKPISFIKISNGGNGGVYKLDFSSRKFAKLKIYPIDERHNRLNSEILISTGIPPSSDNYLAKVLGYDMTLQVGIYEWIEGESVKNVTKVDLDASISFLKVLDLNKKLDIFADSPLASAACFCGLDIENQINDRINKFDAARKNNKELDLFFKTLIYPTFISLLGQAKTSWVFRPYFDEPLSRDQWVLSPSDFGFHNAIRRKDGTIVFTDFEYFGWDDPTKLISDFNLHPGMRLNDAQRRYWVENALEFYGEYFRERFLVCSPLYGLIWCLILINEFRDDVWEQRVLSDSSKRSSRPLILKQKLLQANDFLKTKVLSIV